MAHYKKNNVICVRCSCPSVEGEGYYFPGSWNDPPDQEYAFKPCRECGAGEPGNEWTTEEEDTMSEQLMDSRNEY